MNNIIPFDFEGSSIRLVDLWGSPWFVAMEVAAVLDYSDAFEMTKRLDDDEKQNLQIAGFGPRGVTVISESGLYSAILSSRKPEAAKFKKWVTAEVLPLIRKTGSYTAPKAAPRPSGWPTTPPRPSRHCSASHGCSAATRTRLPSPRTKPSWA